MIGDWVDSVSDVDLLRWVLLAAIVLLAAMAILAVRVVRAILARIALAVLLGAVCVALWVQRADLQECLNTCSCSLFGQSLEIPANRNPNCD